MAQRGSSPWRRPALLYHFMRRFAPLARLAACAGWMLPIHAAEYYLDCQLGRDTNDGRTPATAWQTIARANQQTFLPGDTIRLKRGCSWSGPGFKARGNGSPAQPIILEAYGSATAPRPLIDGAGAHEPAVLLLNVQNWTVRDLELTQHGQAPQNLDPNNEKGKDADQYSDEYMRAVVHVLGLGPPDDPNCGDGCAVRNIRLENLVVRDGSWNGIYVSGGYYQLRSARYGVADNITIAGVESRGHHKAGVEVTCTYYKTRIYAASNIFVLDSHLHHNGGDGAMVGPVRTGLLDGNLCEYNGQLRNARVGAWTWDSENTVIQFNESHHNLTPLNDGKARDGAGFDLDLGTENGVLQYNWSHDNQGEGYLFVCWPVGYGYERGTSRNAQMRYNVSERDGKKLSGGITVFGGVAPAVIYNNTIYYEPDRPAGTPMFQGEGAPLTTSIWGKSGKPDLRIYNNLFITNGRTNRAAVSNNLWSDGAGTFAFDNNLWWRVEGGLRFQWAGAVLDTWAQWRALGYEPQGLNSDPLVRGPLGSGPAAYHLYAGSPAVDRARVVTDALAGMGPRDFFGVSLFAGGTFDIGACEYREGLDPAAPRLLRVYALDDHAHRVELAGLPGRRYVVQRSDDWRSWMPVGVAAERVPGLYELDDAGTAPGRFYRAVTR